MQLFDFLLKIDLMEWFLASIFVLSSLRSTLTKLKSWENIQLNRNVLPISESSIIIFSRRNFILPKVDLYSPLTFRSTSHKLSKVEIEHSTLKGYESLHGNGLWSKKYVLQMYRVCFLLFHNSLKGLV